MYDVVCHRKSYCPSFSLVFHLVKSSKSRVSGTLSLKNFAKLAQYNIVIYNVLFRFVRWVHERASMIGQKMVAGATRTCPLLGPRSPLGQARRARRPTKLLMLPCPVTRPCGPPSASRGILRGTSAPRVQNLVSLFLLPIRGPNNLRRCSDSLSLYDTE